MPSGTRRDSISLQVSVKCRSEVVCNRAALDAERLILKP